MNQKKELILKNKRKLKININIRNDVIKNIRYTARKYSFDDTNTVDDFWLLAGSLFGKRFAKILETFKAIDCSVKMVECKHSEINLIRKKLSNEWMNVYMMISSNSKHYCNDEVIGIAKEVFSIIKDKKRIKKLFK